MTKNNNNKKKTPFLYDTAVENIFINEYMPSAPDKFIKIYLVVLMYENLNRDVTLNQIVKSLGISEGDVKRGIGYWENKGLIGRHKDKVYSISLKENYFGSSVKVTGKDNLNNYSGYELNDDANILENESLKSMYVDIEKKFERVLSHDEIRKIDSAMLDYRISTELLIKVVDYSVNNGKKSINYILKVLKSWLENGYDTVDKIDEHIKMTDVRWGQYKRILTSLGFRRMPTEAEREMIDTWFDEFDYSMDKILEACSKTAGISNPNINYINSILVNWKKEAEGVQVDNANNPRNKGYSNSRSDGKQSIHQRVMMRYDELAKQAQENARILIEEINVKYPRISELTSNIREKNIELLTLNVSYHTNKNELINGLKKEISELENEKNRILHKADIPIDYSKPRYRCSYCNDSGVREDGSRCSCYLDIMNEIKREEKQLL